MGLNSIDTIILEVCERLECVADRCINLGGYNEVKWGLTRLHQSPGSLRVVRMCRRPVLWVGRVKGSKYET